MQINKIREERGNIKTNITEIQRTIKYHEKLYTKLDSLEEMDKFLETYNLPRMNHEEIENLIRTVTSKEIESVIKNLPTNKNLGPGGFTFKVASTFKKELISHLNGFNI